MRRQSELPGGTRTTLGRATLLAYVRPAPLLALALLLVPTRTVEGQTARAGSGSVTLHATARLEIGVRLHARQLAPARIAARSAGLMEVLVPVEVAGNMAWRLSVAAPRGRAPRGSVEVLTVRGDWVPLPADPMHEVPVAAGAATDPVAMTLRFRVADEADVEVVERLRLVLQPEVGAR
jgi:hypothetical protein